MLRHVKPQQANSSAQTKRRARRVWELQGLASEKAWCKERVARVCDFDLEDFGFRRAHLPASVDLVFCRGWLSDRQLARARRCIAEVEAKLGAVPSGADASRQSKRPGSKRSASRRIGKDAREL
eukprot:TRINITY_DN57455_c0_g1_i1.p3 TRINITY_DN57455_c0_g1~~TRINITY_DN57455_c0_g1_i1.p3  ORF type:complete len:134 (-),score=24.37 TRINITY_DN57455_c0_g1_i1:57-428(-)